MDKAEERALLAEVEIGIEVDRFLASTPGRVLLARADAVVDQAVEEMKAHDPHDWKGMQALQNAIVVGESIRRWLEEVILNGQNAEQVLRHMEVPDV